MIPRVLGAFIIRLVASPYARAVLFTPYSAEITGMALIATSKNVIAADEKFIPIVMLKPTPLATCDHRGTLGF